MVMLFNSSSAGAICLSITALACIAIVDLIWCAKLWQIGPFQTSKGEKAKLKVKVRLNIHGTVTVDSAMVSYNNRENSLCSTEKSWPSSYSTESFHALYSTSLIFCSLDWNSVSYAVKCHMKKTNLPSLMHDKPCKHAAARLWPTCSCT